MVEPQRYRFRLYALTALMLLAFPVRAFAVPQEILLFKQAEALYREGKFSPAHSLFKTLYVEKKIRHVRVRERYADTLWRVRGFDRNAREEARALLIEIARGSETGTRKVYEAEAQQSLAELYLTVDKEPDWPLARSYFERALRWWIANDSSDLRKDRIYRMLRLIAEADARAAVTSGKALALSAEVLVQLEPLARNSEEQALIHYLLARSFAVEALPAEQIVREFEKAMLLGRDTPWYDDTLFHYARWLESHNSIVDGGASTAAALHGRTSEELYKKLLDETDASTTPFYRWAGEFSARSSQPKLKIEIAEPWAKLPGAIVLMSDLIKRIDVDVYRVDLTPDTGLAGFASGAYSWSVGTNRWFERVDLSKTRIARWNVKGEGGEVLAPEVRIDLTDQIPRGVYVVQAKAGDLVARELLVRTPLFFTMSRSREAMRFFVADKLTGLPVPEVKIRVWEKRSTAIDSPVQKYSGTTGYDGVAQIAFAKPALPISFDVPAGPSRDDGLLEIVALAEYDGQAAIVTDPEVFIRKDKVDRRWAAAINLSRHILCPGESLNWELFAAKAGFSPREHDRVTASVTTTATEEQFGKSTTELKEFGRANGFIRLPDSISGGEYRLVLSQTTSFGGPESKIGEQSFVVDDSCAIKVH